MFNFLSPGCAESLLINVNVIIIIASLCAFSSATADMTALAQYGEAGGSYVVNIVRMFDCVLLILLSFLGCLCIVRKTRIILRGYLWFMTAYLMMQLIIYTFFAIKSFGLLYRVSDLLREDFYSNVTGLDRLEHEQLWDKLQTSFKCCGLTGPEDYAALSRPISVSCCHSAQIARNDGTQEYMYRACVDSKTYYGVGCEDQIVSKLDEDSRFIFAVAVASSLLEVTDPWSLF